MNPDPTTAQLAIHAVLDIIWPLLPAHILDQLAYV